MLDEYAADTADAFMGAFQLGLNWKFADGMYFKFAPTYYATDNMRGNTHPYSAGTNSRANNRLVFEYNAFAGDAEIGFTKVTEFIPFVALYGQYVQSDANATLNQDRLDDNTGYLYGIKFGHKKVDKLWQWQANYNYRRLERDAWPDFLPDSDFYGGDTNVEGHEVEFTLGINKYVTLGLDYYKSRPIRLPAGATDRDQDLLQLDLILKW